MPSCPLRLWLLLVLACLPSYFHGARDPVVNGHTHMASIDERGHFVRADSVRAGRSLFTNHSDAALVSVGHSTQTAAVGLFNAIRDIRQHPHVELSSMLYRRSEKFAAVKAGNCKCDFERDKEFKCHVRDNSFYAMDLTSVCASITMGFIGLKWDGAVKTDVLRTLNSEDAEGAVVRTELVFQLAWSVRIGLLGVNALLQGTGELRVRSESELSYSELLHYGAAGYVYWYLTNGRSGKEDAEERSQRWQMLSACGIKSSSFPESSADREEFYKWQIYTAERTAILSVILDMTVRRTLHMQALVLSGLTHKIREGSQNPATVLGALHDSLYWQAFFAKMRWSTPDWVEIEGNVGQIEKTIATRAALAVARTVVQTLIDNSWEGTALLDNEVLKLDCQVYRLFEFHVSADYCPGTRADGSLKDGTMPQDWDCYPLMHDGKGIMAGNPDEFCTDESGRRGECRLRKMAFISDQDFGIWESKLSGTKVQVKWPINVQGRQHCRFLEQAASGMPAIQRLSTVKWYDHASGSYIRFPPIVLAVLPTLFLKLWELHEGGGTIVGLRTPMSTSTTSFEHLDRWDRIASWLKSQSGGLEPEAILVNFQSSTRVASVQMDVAKGCRMCSPHFMSLSANHHKRVDWLNYHLHCSPEESFACAQGASGYLVDLGIGEQVHERLKLEFERERQNVFGGERLATVDWRYRGTYKIAGGVQIGFDGYSLLCSSSKYTGEVSFITEHKQKANIMRDSEYGFFVQPEGDAVDTDLLNVDIYSRFLGLAPDAYELRYFKKTQKSGSGDVIQHELRFVFILGTQVKDLPAKIQQAITNVGEFLGRAYGAISTCTGPNEASLTNNMSATMYQWGMVTKQLLTDGVTKFLKHVITDPNFWVGTAQQAIAAFSPVGMATKTKLHLSFTIPEDVRKPITFKAWMKYVSKMKIQGCPPMLQDLCPGNIQLVFGEGNFVDLGGMLVNQICPGNIP